MKHPKMTITLCLLGGAVAQSLVAWSVAWGPRPSKSGDIYQANAYLDGQHWSGCSAGYFKGGSDAKNLAVELFDKYNNEYQVDSLEGLRSIHIREERGLLATLRFIDVNGMENFGDERIPDRVLLKSGYPFRSFSARCNDSDEIIAMLTEDKPWSSAWMVKVQVAPEDQWTQHQMLDYAWIIERYEYHPIPLKPLPLGLIANTILYSLPLLFLAWVPGVIARRLRKPGKCATCGYNAAGLARCPECGSINPAASSPSSAGGS